MNSALPMMVLSMRLPLADLRGYGQSALTFVQRAVSGTHLGAKGAGPFQNPALVATGAAGAVLVLLLVCVILLCIRARRDTKKCREELAKAVTLTQAAQFANQTKGEFLASMSQRIRTPMDAIVGFTDLALKTDLDRELREYLDTVRTSADWLMHIANDVLEFSRMEAGTAQVASVPFSIADCLSSATKIVEREASAKKLAITCKIDPHLPEVVCGDAARLRHVVFNLLDYAVRFTASKSIMLSAALESDSADDVVVRMALTETGGGTPPAKQPLIFEPLRSGEAAAALKAGATGVGLATARRLVELMGGTVEFPSESDARGTFAFTARFQKQKTAETLDAAVQRAESVRLKELSILVAEHNAVNRDAVVERRADAEKHTADPERRTISPLPDLKASAVELAKTAFTREHIEEEITSPAEIAAGDTDKEARTAASAEGEFAETIPPSPGQLAPDTTGQSYAVKTDAISSTESLPIEAPDLNASPYLLPKVAEVETNSSSSATSLAFDAEIDAAHKLAIDATENLLVADSEENVPGKANQSAEIIGILIGEEAPNVSSDHRAANAQLSAPAVYADIDVAHNLALDAPEELIVVDSGENAAGDANQSTQIVGILTGQEVASVNSDHSGVGASTALSAPAIDAEIDLAHNIPVDASEKLLLVDSDENAPGDADQSAQIVGLLTGQEAASVNSDHSGVGANRQVSAPVGLALLQATCEVTQQSTPLTKQDDGPTATAAWNPFEQARKSLSKSRFDVRMIHNDGDPSDRNLI